MTRTFISYCHQQGNWVWGRLSPCLKAGGAEVLIDRERFEVGKALIGQMDALQDQADQHLLVLSADYLSSPYCRHEMDRAIALDPDFKYCHSLAAQHMHVASLNASSESDLCGFVRRQQTRSVDKNTPAMRRNRVRNHCPGVAGSAR